MDANNKLGEFLISGCERAKAGVAQVEVTFALDANGILNVTAQDKVSPPPLPLPLPLPPPLSESQAFRRAALVLESIRSLELAPEL